MAAGAVTAALALTAAGVGIAQAATAPPPLSFVSATANVTAERYVWGDEVYLSFDLGLHVIAGNDPFEIWAKRTSYDQPIVAQRVVKKKKVALPAGTVTDFSGLKDFTTITLADESGAVIREYNTSFCGNSWGSARTRPDAPATTPYPTSCGDYNPFTLGAVWGIQAGWDSTVPDYPPTGNFDLAPGKYHATVVVNPKYQAMFGIPAESATVQVGVTVVDVDVDGKAALAKAKQADLQADAPVVAQGADEHSQHDAEGDAAKQVSSYLPEFRAPAKAPTTLAAAPAGGPKPDLRSLPAWEISLSQGDPDAEENDGKWYVNFGATVWNGGTSPLLVDGFRRTGSDLMDAYQYFFDAKGNQVGSQAAGTMEWDDREGHKHWHFTDFAQYNLLDSSKQLSVRSGKEAFCLANTDAVDYTLPNAKWQPQNTDLSTSCGANTVVAVREVLDIGNGDTYSQYRPGQSFEVTDLPNGTYYIQVLANPAGKLAEVSTTNNSSLREIVLGGTPEQRTLTVPPLNGLDG
jgi:hypothetical protein